MFPHGMEAQGHGEVPARKFAGSLVAPGPTNDKCSGEVDHSPDWPCKSTFNELATT